MVCFSVVLLFGRLKLVWCLAFGGGSHLWSPLSRSGAAAATPGTAGTWSRDATAGDLCRTWWVLLAAIVEVQRLFVWQQHMVQQIFARIIEDSFSILVYSCRVERSYGNDVAYCGTLLCLEGPCLFRLYKVQAYVGRCTKNTQNIITWQSNTKDWPEQSAIWCGTIWIVSRHAKATLPMKQSLVLMDGIIDWHDFCALSFCSDLGSNLHPALGPRLHRML